MKISEVLKFVAVILFLSIMAGVLYIVFQNEEKIPEDQSKKIKQLTKDLNQSKEREKTLSLLDSAKTLKIDSLQDQIKEIKKETAQSIAEIDEVIEKDSSKALEKNREALRDLGIKTDLGPLLSNFEMGWNAKFLKENIGMKLQIRKLEEKDLEKDQKLSIKDQRLKEKDKQLVASDSLKILADLQTEHFKKKYLRTQNFFYDRIIFYGGCGLNYNGVNIVPGVQIGIGIKIYGIKFEGDDQ